LALGAIADISASRDDLVAENRLLRQQLILLRRQLGRPRLNPEDRVTLVVLASRTKSWASAMLIVKPETLLRWHREGFRLFWRRRSTVTSREPRVASETIALIRKMARNNKLWGAERIRGELIKLGIRHAKSTIQKYMRAVRPSGRSGQTWSTFIKNHARHLWACDYVQTYDLFFRPIFAFFILEIGSRRIVHIGVTRSPTSQWTAQQLREATPWRTAPRFVIRDRDSKYGVAFDNAAVGVGIRVLQTPFRAPNANAYCERLIGSVRRECLDHVVIVSERQLLALLTEYGRYYNRARPHQGIAQRVPEGPEKPTRNAGRIVEIPAVGGLHHEYRLAA
jgi:transposase InsO family protein